MRDCSEVEASGETDSLIVAFNSLERRWADICSQAADRKKFIKDTWPLWEELLKLHADFLVWLTRIEEEVEASGISDTTLVPYDQLGDVNKKMHALQREVHEHTKDFEVLNQAYRGVARFCGPKNRLDQSGSIKKRIQDANTRYHKLNKYIAQIIKRLKRSSDAYNEFNLKKDRFVTLLASYNTRLEAVEDNKDQKDYSKKKAVNVVVADLKKNKKEMGEFNGLIEGLFQRSSCRDAPRVEEELEPYARECRQLHARLTRLAARYAIDVTDVLIVVRYILSNTDNSSILPGDEVDDTSFVADAGSFSLSDEGDTSLVPDEEMEALEPTLNVAIVGGAVGRSVENELRAALEETRRLLVILDAALVSPTPEGDDVDRAYYDFVSHVV
jgi:hypothetical protein